MKKNVFFVTTALVGASFMAQAAAQIDEIVVTATKREQTLQEVPIAVSVVQEETVADAQIIDALDLQSLVPSLRVSQLERSSNTTFIIRGQGNGANNPGIEPSVAVYIDGVFRSRAGSALSDLISLERVEVLRGPQSTLFGKNATSGVVSIVTKKPEYEWSGVGEFTYGNYDSKIARGYITGPLNDIFAFSLAGSINQRDGYFENNGPANDLNERDRWAIRGQLLAQPTDNLEFRLIADYDKIDENCCGTQLALGGDSSIVVGLLGGAEAEPGFTYETNTDFNSQNEIDNYGASFHADWDITPNMTLSSITAYREYEDLINYEGDFTTLELLGTNIRDLEAETFTQELRLVGNWNDRVNYLFGAFYYNEELTNTDARLYGDDARPYVDFLVDGPSSLAGGVGTLGALEGAIFGAGAIGNTFYQDGGGTSFVNVQDDTQFQLFTQMDINITDKLVFTGGVAYFQADKEVDFRDVTRTNPFSDLNLVEVGFGLNAQAAAAGGADLTDAATLAVLQQGAETRIADAIASGTSIPVDAAGNPTADPNAIAGTVDAATGLPSSNALLELFFGGLQPLGPLTPFPNEVEDGESTDTDWPYTLRLAYDATDRTNVYVSYARGFKASSWNLTPDTRPFASDIGALSAAGDLATDTAIPGTTNATTTAIALGQYAGTRLADPEITKTFEIGLKTQFSWGQFNIALFDQTVEGFQSSTFQGTGFVLANAGEQSAQGVEFDTIIAPPMIPGLTFNISGLWIDAEYEEFEGAPVVSGSDRDLADGVQDGVADLSGEEVAGISPFSGSFGLDYRRDFSQGEAFFRMDYQYESSVRLLENVAPEVEREVGTLNASAGVNFNNGVELLLWGRNINQDEYYTSGFPTTLQTTVSAYPNQPRTYGVTVRKRF
ncbi:MAG: TonB-dependent receptor [Pseudomonadota bacterium]